MKMDGAAMLRKVYEKPRIEIIEAEVGYLLEASGIFGDDATEAARSRLLDLEYSE